MKKLAPVTIALAGHVDHGKSTLIARLLHDSGNLPEGKAEAIRTACARRKIPFEWAFVLDAFKAERDQAVTIDTTQCWLRTPARDVLLIDVPGHEEFLRNMMTGASHAQVALVLIDAARGAEMQTRRHIQVLSLSGIRRAIVVVNKMDLAGYRQEPFEKACAEVNPLLEAAGLETAACVPVAASEGENLCAASSRMPWYTGDTLIAALQHLALPSPAASTALRLPIQDVYRLDERRILVGRIESGTLHVGDTLLFSPANTSARVASIEAWPPANIQEAQAGQAIGITLDQPLFIERGQTASHVEHAPKLTTGFSSRLVWFARSPLVVGARMRLRINTAQVLAEARAITHVLDMETMQNVPAQEVARHQLAEVVWHVRGLAAVDDGDRLVVLDEQGVAGGGVIDSEAFSDLRVAHAPVRSTHLSLEHGAITPMQRAQLNGHLGAVLWFTGLSGAGKSTLARHLEQRLFAKHAQVYVLDGDTIRRGLSADLGFSHDDRAENIRRIGEVATLFAQAGFIVIASFISPYREDRRRARAAAGELFHEIHIHADLATCEARDHKGLYKKARAGEIAHFTGISDAYEAPEQPDLKLDTDTTGIEACTDQLMQYVMRECFEPLKHPEWWAR